MSLKLVRPRVAFAATLGLALCLVTGTVMAALAAPAAEAVAAAPKDSAPVTRTAVAAAIPQTPIDPAPICSKMRRKLWVEGEGWIVRRVSAC
jgi:hypothetical protein